MTSAEILSNIDRCPRCAFWAQKWEANAIHPNEVLRRAVQIGLLSTEEDPGQHAGDTVMTLAAERTLDVDGSQYDCAMHHAALADIIVSALRPSGASWALPADKLTKTLTWESGAFLAPSGVRLRRVLLVDRWSDDRLKAETHSWRGLGEIAIYQMPMTMSVILIGQCREGKHHSPWSKGWLWRRGRQLRIRRVTRGTTDQEFRGDWEPIWREQADYFSRDKWLDQMTADRVMGDVMFEKEIAVPTPDVLTKIRHLAMKKLDTLYNVKETPDPNPSVCDWPVPCQFRSCCWEFAEPSERKGFIPVSAVSREPPLAGNVFRDIQ